MKYLLAIYHKKQSLERLFSHSKNWLRWPQLNLPRQTKKIIIYWALIGSSNKSSRVRRDRGLISNIFNDNPKKNVNKSLNF